MVLKINVSEKAAEKPRVRGDLPLGWFHLRITGVNLKESTSDKNPGKPMYEFELEITDDARNPQDENGASQFAGRPEWITACLWEGAEFTIVGILRALGYEIEPGVLNVPDITDPECELGGIDAFLGKELMGRYGIRRKERLAATKEKRKPEPEWNTFKSADEDDDTPSTATAVPATGRRRTLA